MIFIEKMFQAIVNFYIIGRAGIETGYYQQTTCKKFHFKIFAKVSAGKRN
jgi:hypothetical protein